MGASGWLTIHWLEALQSLGIISGFIFTAVSLRRESRARKISNMIALAERHHAIWKELYHRPELARILDEQLGPDSVSPTREERLFVTSLILHLDGIHRTLKAGMLVQGFKLVEHRPGAELTELEAVGGGEGVVHGHLHVHDFKLMPERQFAHVGAGLKRIRTQRWEAVQMPFATKPGKGFTGQEKDRRFVHTARAFADEPAGLELLQPLLGVFAFAVEIQRRDVDGGHDARLEQPAQKGEVAFLKIYRIP